MSDFGDFEFAAGSLYGHRMWLPGPDGALCGMTYSLSPWTSGLNEAQCLAFKTHCPCEVCATWERFQFPEPEHIAAHTCGFYAYYRGMESMYSISNAARYCPHGVIEGFGLTVVGTKGFRCTKARIKGLYIPRPGLPPEMLEHVAGHYQDIPQFDSPDALYEAFPPSEPPRQSEAAA